MVKLIKRLTDEEIRQQYAKRFKAFLKQVKKCLPDELEMIKSMPNFTITDITGSASPVEMATIYQKNVPEPDNFVADIIPFGATSLLGEGILEISGVSGEERLTYTCKNTILPLPYQFDLFYSVSLDIESDGWYWQGSREDDATLVTCELLLDLINKVSEINDEF